MRKDIEEARQIASCRVGRAVNTRLVRSSQMPKDFFSGMQSSKVLNKARSSEAYSIDNDKFILEEFKSMFKMRRNLQSLALKLNPKNQEIQSWVDGPDKQNIQIRLPSLHVNKKGVPKLIVKVKRNKTQAEHEQN